MADIKLETTEPDPSSTGVPNDTPMNDKNAVHKTDLNADANSKIDADMKSEDDVDRLIAEVDAKKQDSETKKAIPVEANGHEVTNAQPVPADEKKIPSKRVQEARDYNNRERDRDHGRDGKYKKNHRQNIKSDLTSQKESDDPVAIRKQVEFYFSDSNLLTDKFLFNKVQGHDNLPVPIGIIHSFKRMRHFQPFSAIVDALKESKTLDVVNKDEIRRKVPLPEGLKDKKMHEIREVTENEFMKRSVYVKGFGDEEPSTQFDIEAFFAKYGTTNSVRLRRTYDKNFKGSVFVEFDSEEAQHKFLTLDPSPKYNGRDLIIKSKKQYCDDKVEDIREGRIKPQSRGDSRNHGRDDRDWRTRRDEEQRDGYGRGGRGRAGHRGHRGRGGHQGRESKQERDERNVPKVATTVKSEHEEDKQPSAKADDDPQPNGEPDANQDTAAAMEVDSNPKKRGREEENESEEGQASKKVDTKETPS